MKIELDVHPDDIINEMGYEDLVEAIRDKFREKDCKIKMLRDRCDQVGGWFDDLLDTARSGKFDEDEDEYPYTKYEDWDFGE